jgi:hypothetical protein
MNNSKIKMLNKNQKVNDSMELSQVSQAQIEMDKDIPVTPIDYRT